MRPYFPTWTDEQLKIRAAWLPSCDERAVVESYRKFHEEDFFVSWRRVPPPVLFLNGGTSPVVPPAALAEIRAANPQASIETVPAAGHMIPWDNFTGFMQAVQRFVGKQG